MSKKPVVPIEKAREWLRRVEENGATPPEIAEKDNYDVRTVRKQLDRARLENERHEARVHVFRENLQRHFDDLVNFASEFKTGIQKSSNAIIFEQDWRWNALKAHIPRSPLWKTITKLQIIDQKLREDIEVLRKESVIVAKKKLKQVFDEKQDDIHLIPEQIAVAMTYRAQLLQDSSAPDLQLNVEDDSVQFYYGRYNLGRADIDKAESIKKTVTDLIEEVNNTTGAEGVKRKTGEREAMLVVILAELEIIERRRIVPGLCKYCPL